jgi:hypothetical protein
MMGLHLSHLMSHVILHLLFMNMMVLVMNRGVHPKPLMEKPPILEVILPLKKHHQMKVHQFQTLT